MSNDATDPSFISKNIRWDQLLKKDQVCYEIWCWKPTLCGFWQLLSSCIYSNPEWGDKYPDGNHSWFIPTYKQTIFPLEIHDGFFVRTNQPLADSFGTYIPQNNRGIVGSTDSHSIISQYLADTSSELKNTYWWPAKWSHRTALLSQKQTMESMAPLIIFPEGV